MTAYILITDAETDPEAPLTSELAKKWRDNPLAIQEGDASAPKIQMKAIPGLVGVNRIDHNNTTAVTSSLPFTSTWLSADLWADSGPGVTNTLRMRVSSDGGTTWSAQTTLISLGTTTTANAKLYLNRLTGVYDCRGSGGGVTSFRNTGTITVSSIINAIEFNLTTSGGAGRHFVSYVPEAT